MHAWAQNGFFGGHVGLDFVNTVDDEGKTRAADALPDWETVLAWATQAGVLEQGEARSLAGLKDGAPARDELAQLHRLRESAWRVLSAIATGRAADRRDLEALSAAIRRALGQASLEQEAHTFRWSVREAELGLGILRTRLALELLDLLSREDLSRLRECSRCTGLFLDHGRGVGRRWCRMKTCGNRAKTERFRNKSPY